MTDESLRNIIESVEEAEGDDWEETTREERYWMQTARDLALIVQKMRKPL